MKAISIATSKLQNFTDTLKRLEKLALKCNQTAPQHKKIGEPYLKTVTKTYHEKGSQFQFDQSRKVIVEFQDFELDIPLIVLPNGHKYICTIDMKTKMVAGTLPLQMPIKNYCEHCNSERSRNKLIIVEDDQGNQKQIGSTCVKLYLGIDGEKLAEYSGLLQTFIVFSDCQDEENETSNFNTGLSRVDALTYAIRDINERGYNKVIGDRLSTRDCIRGLSGKDSNSTQIELDQIAEMCDYYKQIQPSNGFEHNLKIIAECDYIDDRYIGIAVYMPIAYRTVKQEKSPSKLLGTIAEKITFEASLNLIAKIETQYGIMFKYELNSNGNTLYWCTSKEVPNEAKSTFKAIIKERFKNITIIKNLKKIT